MVVLWVNLG